MHGFDDPDGGPQGREDQLRVVYHDGCVVVADDVRPDREPPAVVHGIQVEAAVELVVARQDRHLTVVIRRPVPEGMFRVVLTQVGHIAGQYEHIARNLQGVFLQVAGVV